MTKNNKLMLLAAGVAAWFLMKKSGGGLGMIVDDPNNSAAYIDENGMILATQIAPNINSDNRVFFEAAGLAGLPGPNGGKGRGTL